MKRKVLASLVGVAALLLVTAGAGTAVAGSAAVSPQAKSFSLGTFKVSVLRDGKFSVPNNGAVFGLNAGVAAVAQVLARNGLPTGQIPLAVDVLLVRLPDHLVLMDTGNGEARGGVLEQSLALAGESPEAITDVLVTHVHPDHVGGLVTAAHRSAFPNATIWISRKDWTFLQDEPGVREEVPIIKEQVKTFAPGEEILPGIRSVDLAGHTPGQVGYVISSQGHQLMDLADVAHSAILSLAKPQWTLGWDANKAEAARVRAAELARLAAAQEWIFAPHFPFPGVGRIEQSGDGFRFVPGLPPENSSARGDRQGSTSFL